MDLTTTRALVKASINDVAGYQVFSDTEYNNFIRRAVLEFANTMNENKQPYYKKVFTMTVVNSIITNKTDIEPVAEKIQSLIYAYIKDGSGVKYLLEVCQIEDVMRHEYEGASNCSIAFGKEGLSFHVPSTLVNFTLYLAVYSYPTVTTTDASEIDVPANFTDYIVNLAKKYVYEARGMDIPSAISQNIYSYEASIRQ